MGQVRRLSETTGVGGRSDDHGQTLDIGYTTINSIKKKKLTGKNGGLSGHEKLKYHKNSNSAMINFEKTVIERRELDIMSQLHLAHQEEVVRNRMYLKAIAEIY